MIGRRSILAMIGMAPANPVEIGLAALILAFIGGWGAVTLLVWLVERPWGKRR